MTNYTPDSFIFFSFFWRGKGEFLLYKMCSSVEHIISPDLKHILLIGFSFPLFFPPLQFPVSIVVFLLVVVLLVAVTWSFMFLTLVFIVVLGM